MSLIFRKSRNKKDGSVRKEGGSRAGGSTSLRDPHWRAGNFRHCGAIAFPWSAAAGRSGDNASDSPPPASGMDAALTTHLSKVESGVALPTPTAVGGEEIV